MNMSREIRADYSQTFLLPPSLEDWVGADHPARFIRDFVESFDLEVLGFEAPVCETGRPPYSNELLLGVWLYGYVQKIRSSRGLERACRDNMSLLWLTGMNSPDHNTLWRFYRANKKALRLVFRQLVGVACRSGLVGLVVHAVDGTKIRSRSSDGSAWHKGELETLLKSVDSSIEAMMLEIESSEVSESGDYRLPEDLVDAQKRRAEIKHALLELSEIERDHMHPDEPEARMMRSGGVTHLSYNAQAVVDGDSELIVAEDVVNAESDSEMLVEMVDDVVDNVGEAAEETLSDGGYYSPGQLAKAEERGHGVLVPVPESSCNRGRFSKAAFRYDESEDVYICPEGQRLTYWRTRPNSHGKYLVRHYRCRHAKNCPVRWACSPNKKKGRTILRGEHEGAVLGQREKQKSVRKQEMMTWRKWIVEPVFGHIKENMGFRRWTVRGIENVRTQWSLICTAFNLQKLYKYWLEGRLVLNR
jgi:transposase